MRTSLASKMQQRWGQQPPPSNFEKEDSMFGEGFGWKAVAMGQNRAGLKKTHQGWAKTSPAQKRKKNKWGRGNYFPPSILLHAERNIVLHAGGNEAEDERKK